MTSHQVDDTSDTQQSSSQRIPTFTQYQSHKTPDNFVFGNRNGLTDRNDDQQYHFKTSHRVNESDYEVELLKHLSDDFAQLLNRADSSDCLLNVKGTYMAVHRCVLAARSNTFAAILSNTTNRLDASDKEQLKVSTEKDKLVISIEKTSPDIMKQVIIFLYTSRCELNERNAYALLDVAGRYDIKSLKVHTGRFLANHISTNNVLSLIEAAYKYGNTLVRQKCIGYFIEHAKEIMDMSKVWKDFAEKHPPIVSELLYWSVNKDKFRETMSQSDSQW